MAKDLQFNVDDLTNQADAIKKISEDLRLSTEKLSSSLDDLRGDWDSAAGEKFFSIYDTAWVQHVGKYCDMLEELSMALRTSRQYYEPLETEYNRINL